MSDVICRIAVFYARKKPVRGSVSNSPIAILDAMRCELSSTGVGVLLAEVAGLTETHIVVLVLTVHAYFVSKI